MPSISFIVARSFPGNVIGYKNKLPWHIKSDLQRFRKITTGHVVIMGRATFESIGRPLPNRTNIVLSRNPALTNRGGINFDEGTQLSWTDTHEDALLAADIISICRQQENIFVIGGETMYRLFGDLVNKVFLTEVFADVPGDAHFERKFPRKEWKLVLENDFSKNYDGDQYSHRFSIYERKERKNRYEFVSRFFSDRIQKNEWLSGQLKRNKPKLIEYIQENLDLNQEDNDLPTEVR
jgi:dihydrofolate reductase